MDRDPALLRRSAQRLSADLQVALGDGWVCAVDESLVLTVTGPAGSESTLLEREVADFFVPDASWPEEQRVAALEEDADDVVASEALEVLRVLQVPGPVCPQHGEAFSSCSSVWVCPEGHDGPFIGELTKR
jgi:hypothetical protein